MQSMIIIGGGILGASAAYHAARTGADVTVIDRNEPGQATGAAAGIVCPWLSQRRNQAWYTLVKNGAAYYPQLIRMLEEDGEKETGYKKTGLIVMNDDNKLSQIEERALKRREDAPQIGEVRKQSAAETQEMYPFAGEEFSSLFVEGAARVNGRELRDALMRAAAAKGVKFVTGNAQLLVENGRAVGVRTEAGELQAQSVIATAGAWAAELFRPLGLELNVKAQKAQIVHLQTAQPTEDFPVVMGLYGQYAVPYENGRVAVGATHENEAGYDLRQTAGGIHSILDKAFAVSPGLAEAEFVETRVGFRPLLPDSVTAVGAVPGIRNLYAANGLGSSGLTAGPYVGSQLAKLVLGEATDLDFDSYVLGRFLKEIK
ncbi:NAD(P)/FAD-dependent oxidoreductase [Planococcus lenghuensis]|uniref:Oxidoreductase n=1 Tax=Planococcus lenghuensis TaxID=2213202 RepID=A0A1Q2KVI6_9BACL|nr:FAD-binding oxidoreductase [Planococcus lenghuensis]AQQ52124.1 oxidoreductase [Planococcus lenghuensis]